MTARVLLLLGIALLLATFAAPQAPYEWWQTFAAGLFALFAAFMVALIESIAADRRAR